ncbi:uncharacterized protein LOC111370029 [Olea europaea var. sylvestris]|uniref:uncharacterized protein LOC111370029 n=1 Tax=Olea europaea var. sylvestris TaxID=158386 RepID=UPI000C1CE80B|nr:uncharacterized protein LOC111370029 [Olea europaea var. sylvestris]
MGKFLPLVEFAYNNSYQATISMAPYESYANKRRKELEFEVGEKVFIKVAPTKGILGFGKRGKLKLRFISPFEIIEKIGNVAYRLTLPPEVSTIHDVFHVSMLRKYIHDPNHVVNVQSLDMKNDMTYEEAPIMIFERKALVLRNREVPLVKVQWSKHGKE